MLWPPPTCFYPHCKACACFGPCPSGCPALLLLPKVLMLQFTSLLKELQSEQRALAAQFAAQSQTVSQLQSDILSARRCGSAGSCCCAYLGVLLIIRPVFSRTRACTLTPSLAMKCRGVTCACRERDAAKQQLERVQHLLAANTEAAIQGAMACGPCGNPSLDLDALAITTVLPASAALIPSQLPMSAKSQPHQPPAAYRAAQPSVGQAARLRAGSSTAAASASKQQKAVMSGPSSRKASGGAAGVGTAMRAKASKPGSRGWS
jgi:hypothetical protein